MPIVPLEAIHGFGLQSKIAGNVAFMDDNNVIYPSGASIIIYNILEGRQQVMLPSDKSKGCTCFALDPSKNILAIAEKGDHSKCFISVYDLQTMRRKKILSHPDYPNSPFIHMSFSSDTKNLAALMSGPEFSLAVWAWDRAKVIGSLRTTINNPAYGPMLMISFNPANSRRFVAIGQKVYRQYICQDGTLSVYKPNKVELPPPEFRYSSACWLNEEQILVGLNCNKVQLYDAQDLKAEFTIITDVEDRKFLMADVSEDEYAVKCIYGYEKGFICGCGTGMAHLFEKTDDDEYFHKVRQIEICSDPLKSYYGGTIAPQHIEAIDVNPSRELLYATTTHSQLYSYPISYDSVRSKVAYFESNSPRFHFSTITGLDICYKKPYIVTCGLDKSVRIWNYVSFNQELCKEFSESAYSISLHPSGLFFAAGFENNVRLLNIMIDDIQTFKEFPIKRCNEVKFSNGGHMFAAINNNVVDIYSTNTYELLSTIKGHTTKVTSLHWSEMDNHIVTAGKEGAIYEWDVVTTKRINESVLKGCSYACVTQIGRTIYAVGSDNLIKEITDSLTIKEVPTASTHVTKLALARSGKFFFVGTALGSIRSMKFPLTMPGEWIEYQGHTKAITSLKVTFDEKYLISSSEDGSIIIWKIQDMDSRILKREVVYSKEILATKADLEEQKSMVKELRMRVDELKAENLYQLRMKDVLYNENVRDICANFTTEMELVLQKNLDIKNEKDELIKHHAEQVKQVVEKFNKEIKEKETANKQQLLSEFEKYQELKEKGTRMQEDYETRIEEMEQKFELSKSELREFYENQILEEKNTIIRIQEEHAKMSLEHEEELRQIEEDSDFEIHQLKQTYEHLMFNEKNVIMQLMTDTSSLKKQLTALKKMHDEWMMANAKLTMEISKLNGTIESLELDIAALNKELNSREESIKFKDLQLVELRKKNQELAKFKYVLEFKVQDLRKQIEPKEAEMQSLRFQISGMEADLMRFHKDIHILEQSVAEAKDKTKASLSEAKIEHLRAQENMIKLKQLKKDVHDCAGIAHLPIQLKEKVLEVFHKHVTDKDLRGEDKLDLDAQCEELLQRNHLEMSISSLKRLLNKEKRFHEADNNKIMQQNITLMREIDESRMELKAARKENNDLEVILELKKHTKMSTGEILASFVSQANNARVEKELEECKNMIELQKHEIKKLTSKICKLERSQCPRE